MVSGHLPEKWRLFVFPKTFCASGLEFAKIRFGQTSIRASVLL